MSTSVLLDAVAPNPRMSTVVRAPFTPPNRLVTWTPGSRARMSWTVTPGERSMSVAVMTVVEAPVMVVSVTMPDGFSTDDGAGRGRFARRLAWAPRGASYLRIALARRRLGTAVPSG